jgi:hypothetical protein
MGKPQTIRSVNGILFLAPLMLGLLLIEGPFERLGEWKPLYQGVEQLDFQVSKPRRIAGHAIRIDLETPGLRFLATPGNGDRPDHTDGLKTSTFLTRHGCQLAINAAPFSPIHKEEGKPQKIHGLTISGGKQVSPPHDNSPALLITNDNKARISAPPFDTKDIETAVGGFGIVLKDGKIQAGGKDVHPRTAAGISKDGKTLFLLVVDGRQPLRSLGMTTQEVGECLFALGAWQGINLDGGGTTTLVVSENGKAKVVNRPIHGGLIPGTERVSASHLGIFAPALKKRQ